MLISNVTHQRETLTEWPIRLPLTLVLPSFFCNTIYQGEVVNPRPTKLFFFCNMVYQVGWLPPPYELEIDGPKV